MYHEGIEPFLENLEDKNIGIAGGSVVAMVLSSINSLIIYISNLTIGKKKYVDVEEQVKTILQKANELKQKSLEDMDNDKIVLDKILATYKNRNEAPEEYYKACKEGVEFGMDVLKMAVDVLELSEEISQCGNRMLSSDFQICAYLGLASVQSAIVNVKINIIDEFGEAYINEINEKCTEFLKQATEISNQIILNAKS